MAPTGPLPNVVSELTWSLWMNSVALALARSGVNASSLKVTSILTPLIPPAAFWAAMRAL